MKERDFKFLAKEIKMLKGATSDLDRLRFLCILRDAFQFSKNWPGMTTLMRMCDIPENTGTDEKVRY